MQKISMRLSIFPDLIFIPTKGVYTTEETFRTGFIPEFLLWGLQKKLIGKKLTEDDYQTIENKLKAYLVLYKK